VRLRGGGIEPPPASLRTTGRQFYVHAHGKGRGQRLMLGLPNTADCILRECAFAAVPALPILYWR
jgi:hypothetical protein